MTIEQFLENTKYIRGIEVRSDLKSGGGGGGDGEGERGCPTRSPKSDPEGQGNRLTRELVCQL